MSDQESEIGELCDVADNSKLPWYLVTIFAKYVFSEKDKERLPI